MRNYANQYKKITDEMRSKIIELWQLEMPGGAIAAELGITRNSVIGIIYRARENGAVLRQKKFKIARPAKIKIEKKVDVKVVKEKVEKIKKVKREKAIEKIFEPIEVIQDINCEEVNMDGLNYYSCRFIVQEGNYETTKYCGKKINRSSYCQQHYDICYYPSRFSAERLVKV